MSDQTKAYTSPNFWQRPFAMVIDMIIIALLGQILILFFHNFLSSHLWGSHLIGTVLALSYFAILDSKFTSGQTPGKKILRIRVISVAGTFLTPFQALLRAILPVTPWLLEGLPLTQNEILGWQGHIVALGFYGVGISQLFVYMVDRPSRMMLQDRLLSSSVTREHEGALPIRPVNKFTIVMISLWMGFVMTWPMVLEQRLNSRPVSVFQPLKDQLLLRDGVITTSINQGIVGRESSAYRLSLRLWIEGQPELSDVDLKDLYALSNLYYPELSELSGLQVVVKTGVDMGVTTSFNVQSYLVNAH